MNKSLKISFLLALQFVWASCVFAQINPISSTFQAVSGQSNSDVTIKSTWNPPTTLVAASGAEYDTLHLQPHASLSNTWVLTFSPVGNFEGLQSFDIEYWELGFGGVLVQKYTTVNYEVKPSVIDASNDYFLSDGTTQTLQVLSNDVSEHGSSLTLSEISYVSGGTASINGNAIEFTPDSNMDRAYIQYIVTDDLGTGSNALACLVDENSYGPVVSKSMHNKESINLHMDDSSCVLVSGSSNGNLVQLNSLIWQYIPNNSFTGSESIEFEDAQGNSTTFEIEVYNKSINTGFVRNDHVYTTINESVTFNVLENDLKSNYNIFSHSPELTNLGNGQFQYTPAIDFEGDKIFEYSIFTGFAFYTGQIYVYVNDQAPINTNTYSFEIYRNEALELNYQLPFDSYYFEVATSASNGTVSILNSNDQVQQDCDYIEGENKIVYTANSDFSGTDQFDIRYCTDYGNCEIVKVDVTILANDAPDCVCYNDCIWPGDINRDGVVSAKDYIYSHFYLGSSGDARASVSTDWESNSCSDWNFDILLTNTDQKNSDSNGDGFVKADDIQVLSTNWGKVNNLLNESAYQLTDLPIQLSTGQTNIPAGDWLYLDITVGNATTPALDFLGLGMTINVNPNLMDSANVVLNIYDSSWAAEEGPMNSMLDVPQDGIIDLGISTISSIGPSGEGVIGQLGFIVEDDLDGWAIADAVESMTIQMNNTFVMNTSGETFTVPDDQIKITLEKDIDLQDNLNAIEVYPNPASSFTNIISDTEISSIAIYELSGKLLSTHNYADSKEIVLDVDHLMDGLYLLKITTGGEINTKKLNKISY